MTEVVSTAAEAVVASAAVTKVLSTTVEGGRGGLMPMAAKAVAQVA